MLNSDKNKVALLGSTGKAGTFILKELIRRSTRLRLLQRNPKNLVVDYPLTEIVEGDALDYDSIRVLVEGCFAVISAIGSTGESSTCSTSTTNIIRAMHDTKIKRYILLAGVNVDAPGDKKSAWTRNATEWMKGNYPEAVQDRQKEFEILESSSIDWTLLRLPWIDLTAVTKDLITNLRDCPRQSIGATTLAQFVADQLRVDTFVKKAVFLGS